MDQHPKWTEVKRLGRKENTELWRIFKRVWRTHRFKRKCDFDGFLLLSLLYGKAGALRKSGKVDVFFVVEDFHKDDGQFMFGMVKAHASPLDADRQGYRVTHTFLIWRVVTLKHCLCAAKISGRLGPSGIPEEGGAVVLGYEFVMNCPGLLSTGWKKWKFKTLCHMSLNYKHFCLAGGRWDVFFVFRLQTRWLPTVFLCHFQMCCCFCQKTLIPHNICDL